MKPVTQMTNDELEREVTQLRNEERAARKATRQYPADKLSRITSIALEQGNRWAREQGLE